ncbi:isochorismatase family protein YecD [Anaerotignum neopropionicum]|uniref:Isochorismatase family protein YecD n=1 Tax=Anaerotignum neopropionicum TaxID=36847 RepID=A0A136WBR2_9FIRM|nr:isochorismatase family cysteine hydrolase [Anaerotignum neopropionicum]KXL51920.1 isochorismatase family protein YecD [Anaerotignum neopropionicum]
MKENPTHAALIVIDMENGFIEPKSAHCIHGAAATVPNCIKAIGTARSIGIPIFFVKRIYRTDGSDVELTRYEKWKAGGRAMTPGSKGFDSAEAPEGMKPISGDYTIIKPRWSAFFHTELDLILRRLEIKTVILIGTTTPNCIRTTAFDADALEYNVVILEDCCSSQTAEIQKANIDDLQRMGAAIMSCTEFERYSTKNVPDQHDQVHREMLQDNHAPEPFTEKHFWTDFW